MRGNRRQLIKLSIKRNRVLIENFSYISLLQIFLLLAPLITYPYLVRVLGMELYGTVITAQILSSYASIIINFGSDSVCAKHVAVNRDKQDKLSEIVSSVLSVRFVLWLITFIIYIGVVFIVPEYRNYYSLFIFTYGLTTNELLFPQYFFQGIEEMKYTTIVNIFCKIVFIILVFFIVKKPDDYLLVPILYTLGYLLGGVYALWVVFKKKGLHFYIPKFKQVKIYVKDSSALFATDLVCTVKDKLNYLLLGVCSTMSNVVVYDLGMKIYGLITRPAGIINVVLFPKSAKSKNIHQFNKILLVIVVVDIIIIGLMNLFLPYIVELFIHKKINLLPVRLFTLAPLFSTTSSFIMSNMCIAYGYNKYALYSILVTTTAYVATLIVFYFTHYLNNLYAFVILAISSYFIEFVYRLYAYKAVSKKENQLHELHFEIFK